ncbi:hypothetical protein ABGB07_31725 [Micromonosporaceae bacterium B7E4]
MSDAEGPLAYLTQLRGEANKSTARIHHRRSEAEAKAFIDEWVGKQFSPQFAADPAMRPIIAMIERLVTWAATNSREMHRVLDEHLTWMQQKIERTAEARCKGLDPGFDRPVIGYLQTGQVNAMCLRVPDGSGHLVVYEDQLLRFIGLLSDLIAFALPVLGNAGTEAAQLHLSRAAVTERIEVEPAVVNRFLEIIAAYAIYGDLTSRVSQQHLPQGYKLTSFMIKNALHYFVIGHEYAHALLGHLRDTEPRKGMLPIDEDARVLPWSWEQELAADELGMVLAIITGMEQDHMHPAYCYMGVELFFLALDVMDRSVALLETGAEGTRQLGSHPPGHLRIQRLREYLPQMFQQSPEHVEALRQTLGVADEQQEVIRLLWEHVRPVLIEQHRDGQRPAGRWRTIPIESER